MSSGPRGVAHPPHMVMIVGNHVVGDSRVEKSADSAVKAGYRVTILGFRHKSVFPFSEYRDVPIIRAASDFARHKHYVAEQELNERDAKLEEALGVTDRITFYRQGLAAVDYEAARGPLTKYAHWARPVVHSAQRAAWRIAPKTENIRNKINNAVEQISDQAGVVAGLRHGGWRRTWPQIADYEEAFVEALIDLEPDIIHAHDRHPMAAAARYAAAMRGQGKTVPWVYDAHEWLPGQVFTGPKRLRAGWLAAEADLIQQADAVLSVSDELADKMRRRHGLRETPTVVVNAPRSAKTPMAPDVRRSLREECGLADETPLMVYVGKLAEVRGIFTMIDALEFLPDVHAAFVASKDPHLRAEMKKRAEDLGVAGRLHIVDYVPAESVTWYVASATLGMSPLLPTSAHHSAMPTKIREYLQSGLPIVASDLLAQGAFLREHGVGELHEPGDAKSLADAVTKILNDYGKYSGAIKEDLLKEHTWEGEEQKLFSVWGQLVPGAVRLSEQESVSKDARPHIAGTRLAFQVAPAEPSSGQSLDDLGRFISAVFDDESGAVADVVETDMSGVEKLPGAFSRWKRLVAIPDAVISSVPAPLIGHHLYSNISERNELAEKGVPRFFVTRSGRLESSRSWLAANPDHPLHELSADDRHRLERQTRPLRSFVRDNDLTVLTTGRLSARLIRNSYYVPVPVEEFSSKNEISPAADGLLRVLVLPTMRSAAEKQEIARLVSEQEQLGVTVSQPSSRRFNLNMLRHADVLVDSLSIGDYSDEAVLGMSIGAAVVGHDTTGSGAPIVDSAPNQLIDSILKLKEMYADAVVWEASANARREFAAREHGAAKTRDAILTAIAAGR